jgi:hypothetical protein
MFPDYAVRGRVDVGTGVPTYAGEFVGRHPMPPSEPLLGGLTLQICGLLMPL